MLLATVESIETGCEEDECEGEDQDNLTKRKALTRMRTSVEMLMRSFTSSSRETPSGKLEPIVPLKEREIISTSSSVDINKITVQPAPIQTAKKPIAGTTTKKLSDPAESHFVNGH